MARDEALCEVADAVVVVAGEVKQVLHPEPERHARVGVVAAQDQDAGVHEDQDVGERRDAETACR